MPFEPQNFFDPGSLTSFGGATTLTWALVAATERFFGLSRKWLPLLAAELVCFGSLLLIGANGSTTQKVGVTAINGLFVALASTGANVTANTPNGPPPKFSAQVAKSRRLWKWIRPRTSTADPVKEIPNGQ